MLYHFFLTIIEQTAHYIPLAAGAYITLSLLKLPDLALESAFLSGGLCAAYVLTNTASLPHYGTLICTLMAAVLGGVTVGLLTSFLHTYIRIPYLLATILTYGIINGIIHIIIGPYISVSQVENPLAYVPITHHAELVGLLILTSIIIIGIYQFCTTQLGYACAVYGMNESFLASYGIATSYVLYLGIGTAHALAGLSGYLITQAHGFADIHMGHGKILLCITTIILGKQLCYRYKKIINPYIPIFGIFAFILLQQLLIYSGYHSAYFSLAQALIVLGILSTTQSTNNTHSRLGI